MGGRGGRRTDGLLGLLEQLDGAELGEGDDAVLGQELRGAGAGKRVRRRGYHKHNQLVWRRRAATRAAAQGRVSLRAWHRLSIWTAISCIFLATSLAFEGLPEGEIGPQRGSECAARGQ